jgi:hypothetical protein
LVTVIGTVAGLAEAMSAAVIAAVSCVALTKVVVRLLPFHSTVDPEMKSAPLTVKVKAAPPAVAEEGDIALMLGTGFGDGPLLPPPPPQAANPSVTRTTDKRSINALPLMLPPILPPDVTFC